MTRRDQKVHPMEMDRAILRAAQVLQDDNNGDTVRTYEDDVQSVLDAIPDGWAKVSGQWEWRQEEEDSEMTEEGPITQGVAGVCPHGSPAFGWTGGSNPTPYQSKCVQCSIEEGEKAEREPDLIVGLQRERMPVTTWVVAFYWRCFECGWLGTGLPTIDSAQAEAGDHFRKTHVWGDEGVYIVRKDI